VVDKHNLKEASRVEEEIENHIGGCSKTNCTAVSEGTIEDFARNLYRVQNDEWGKTKYTYERCEKFIRDLFTEDTVRGVRMENKVIDIIESQLDLVNVERTSSYIDTEYRVDLEVKFEDSIIVGIQVKPNSYNRVSKNIKSSNKEKNSEYPHPVIYIYYNKENEEILNIKNTVDKIRSIGINNL
jgi:hypothetical protein